MAGVGGAQVAVVAILGVAPLANPIGAVITLGACVLVIAARLVRDELATDTGVARIVGTDVVVIADQRDTGGTLPQLALVAHGAGIAVVARCGVRGVHATQFQGARVVCTDVVVIAVLCRLDDAFAVFAVVTGSAWVAVIARCSIGQVYAALNSIATVVSTHVQVITLEGYSLLASEYRVAALNPVAGITVVADQRLSREATH